MALRSGQARTVAASRDAIPRMERVEVELFSDGSNDAVVRMPGRQFPGMVVQGDSLWGLRRNIRWPY